MSTAPIRLAYSPDADDAFMFWAIRHGRIDLAGLSFEHVRADTEALNLGAEAAEAPDVTAVSIHQYAYLADRYLMLPHGGSVGAGYGPVLVAPDARSLESLAGRRVGVPGLRTSAYLVLRLLLPTFEPVIVPVAPFWLLTSAVERASAAALFSVPTIACPLAKRASPCNPTKRGSATAARMPRMTMTTISSTRVTQAC